MSFIIACVLLCGLAATSCTGQRALYSGPFVVGTTPVDVLNEVSGMAQSAEQSVVWMINDSGDEPMLYAIHVRDGLLSKHRIQGASNIDWEDLAIEGSNIYVADIGDNNAKRKNITIYRFPAPALRENTTVDSSIVDRFVLAYPDGPRDAEALLVDPLTQEIVIVTKRESRSRIYSCNGLTTSSAELTYRGELSSNLITSATVSADGRKILLKNYHKVWEWQRDTSEPLWKVLLREGRRITYGPELQGEAICFDKGDYGYYTTSEREDGGDPAPINYYLVESDGLFSAAKLGRDIKLPQIEIEAIFSKRGRYLLRYTLPEVERVKIILYNEGMFKVLTIAEDTAESGVQEREIDLSKFPSGSYAVLLTTPRAQASCQIEHVFR